MRLWGKFRKFMSIPWREKILFSESLFLQFTIGLFLKIIPFKWIPGVFSNPQNVIKNQESSSMRIRTGIQNHKSVIKRTQSEIIPQIKLALQRTSPLSPWRNKCLIQSLAARRMLRRRQIQSQLSLGVTSGTNRKMVAHAWLKVGNFEIVEKRGDYPELYFF